KSGVGTQLLDLLFLRISQINGCAFCLDMHARDLLKNGEDLQRVVSLDAWRDSDFYSPKERAALAWAEAVNALDEHALDTASAELKRHFNEREIAELSFAVATINAWNMMNVSFRTAVERKPLAA
ncbi:MAG TPA: carboxymuconolactone decarboxylase family protein, partial [Gammaproteobacteria bacterium]|nr:carboxymuconolactone decarboxylase family protein [Gammaproteobacteria bacterium]